MSVKSLEDFDRLVITTEVSDGPDSDIEYSDEDSAEKERAVEINALHNANNAAILKLPPEILSYILKWVVSSNLDVVALSNLSLVCKDFYLLSQESDLWHAMCQRVWGEFVIRKPYSSWQMLYISKPHIHFHGVYVSRTSYFRMGSCESMTYSRPYYTVEYFRILRFFPNGEVLMLTTPKHPREIVHKLESKNKKVQALLAGQYTLSEDQNHGSTRTATLSATLEACYVPKDTTRLPNNRNHRAHNCSEPKATNEYKLQLQLTSTSSKKKFNKLVWVQHSCCTSYKELGSANTCTFDVSKKYPPLFFNRVQSFTADSCTPL